MDAFLERPSTRFILNEWDMDAMNSGDLRNAERIRNTRTVLEIF